MMTTDRHASWSPDPRRFLEDLEAKPAALERLAASADVLEAVRAVPRLPRVLFLGMGSSRFAAEDSARRLRTHGVEAISEYASADGLPPASGDLLVVAISASGASKETHAALDRYRGRTPTVAITERPASPVAEAVDIPVPLVCGTEEGGVACRSFQHTGLILRLLEAHLLDRALDFAGLCHRAAEGTTDLLDRRAAWLPETVDALDTDGVVGILAPVERWSCAAQSALVLREGPRRMAVGSETADWSHIDVYLAKTHDYRALLMTGSRYDDEAVAWLRLRGSTVVTLGPARSDIAIGIRHPYSDDPSVAGHVDTLVVELVAARLWAAGVPSQDVA